MKEPHRVDAFTCFFCWAASEGLNGGEHDECNDDQADFERDTIAIYTHEVDVELMVSFMRLKDEKERTRKIIQDTGIPQSTIQRRLKNMGLIEKYPAWVYGKNAEVEEAGKPLHRLNRRGLITNLSLSVCG